MSEAENGKTIEKDNKTKLFLPVHKDKADTDEEGGDDVCKTPTRAENQICIASCPPASRKKRPTLYSHSFKTLTTDFV